LRGSLSENGLTITKDQGRTITGQFSLNYDNTFGTDHHLTGLMLYEVIDYYNDRLKAARKNFLTYAIDQMFAGSAVGMTNDGSASEMGRESVIGRLNYSFRNKYLIETTLRADASAKFSSEKRWGYFPSVSLGWRMSEEIFLKGNGTIDDLKLRASYGSSGNDGVGNFQYLTGYSLGTRYTGGTYLFGNTTAMGTVSTGLANPYLTWEKIKIYNLGLDFSICKRKLYGELDVFYRERSGIPTTRNTSLPSTFGSSLPSENINSLNNRGFELNLGTSGELGELKFDVSGNISWTRAKWEHYEEPSYVDADQKRIYANSGRWTDVQFGYVSDGLFSSQDEISNLGYDQDNQGNKTLHIGDIKYKDVNNDKIVDWKDQQIIGKGTTPHWMVGLTANLNFRNFDMSMLLQGALGYYNNINTLGGLASSVYYEKRWTPEKNNPKAFFTRLGGASSNSWTSDHFYQRADYLRLKTLSIGYNIPKSLLNKYHLGQVRIYTAGTNLLTLSKLGKYNIDPEAPSGNGGYYYPQQRTITLGINLSL
jgi:TonB-linked SusC/RagA family outer membrane protein